MPKTPTQLRIRPETRRKLEAIAKAKRWTLAETADSLADAYIEAHPEIRKKIGSEKAA